jgi:methyl-accepting chemotaxis protein
VSKRSKRPVLTSPWKIGTLVAMLLLVLSFAVGYYIVNIYNVDLTWLNASMGRWGVDSYTFFKEIYPLAAGVVLISLLSYFIIASAVRRYKYYLDSGQDYREMVRVAESIDDLTNPNQVARLSEYPELQSILRNYGDQIREISKEMEKRGKETKSVDLELEIDSLLEGKVKEYLPHEGRWWSSVYNKVQDYVSKSRKRNKDLKKKDELNREIIGRVSLSHGKAIESVGEISEKTIHIVESVDELFRRVEQINTETSAGGGRSKPDTQREGSTSMDEMEASLEKLGDCSEAIKKLSDENNGLALSIALMAARGEVDESKLAKLAEKIRVSAERHKGISEIISTINQSLLDKLGSGAGVEQSAAHSKMVSEVLPSITKVSKEIAVSARELQNMMGEVGEELHDSNKLLRDGFKGLDSGGEDVESDADIDSSVPQDFVQEQQGMKLKIEHGMPSEDGDSELVIDHGRGEWDKDYEMAGEEKEESDGLDSDLPDTVEGEDIEKVGFEEKYEEGESRQADYQVVVDTEPQNETKERRVGGPSGRKSGESWMEMPGHRWVSIDVEKENRKIDQVRVEVDREIDSSKGGVGKQRGIGKSDGNLEEPTSLPGRDGADSGSSHEVRNADSQVPDLKEVEKEQKVEDEKIYDLYELGAVEYREESKI